MFENAQALSRDAHANLRLTNAGYGFARSENFCPIVMEELASAVREYLIVFPNNDTALPHALLGVRDKENLYVDPEGRWRGSYIPAHYRRYPFVLGRAEGAEQGAENFTVAVDANAPQLSTQEGEPLFTAEGEPSELLQHQIKFLRALQQQLHRTQAAVRELESLDLFDNQQLDVQHEGQPVAKIAGLRMVSEERFKALNAENLARLRDSGALDLVYAHLFSRTNLRLGLLAQHTQKPAQQPAPEMASTFSFH